MKRSLTTRGAVTLVAAAGVTVMLSGVSYAYWSVTGSGTGTAAATTATPLVVSTITPVSGLYPGATLQGTLTVANPNPFAVQVTAITFAPATADAEHAGAGCSPTGVTLAATVSTVSPVTVAAKSTGQTVAFTATMTGDSPDACQGATFTATVTSLTAASSS